MIVAITGGTGFIGRRLVLRHHAFGNEVRVLSRQSSDQSELPNTVKWWKGSLTNSSNLTSFVDSVDVLYHCAAENTDSTNMIPVNVHGTKNLILAASGRIRHWVQLSSVGVYGTHADGEINEETPIAPINVYEKSKAVSEHIVIEAAEKHNFTYSILRPSKVYGLGMKNKTLYQLISLIDKRMFFFIGNPGASANYIHVDDVVEALVRCAYMPAAINRIYNISDFRTLEDFIAIIAEKLHRPFPHRRVPENITRLIARMTAFIPGNPLTEQRINAMVKRAIYLSLKLKLELGDWHFVSAEDGLKNLVDYWKLSR